MQEKELSEMAKLYNMVSSLYESYNINKLNGNIPIGTTINISERGGPEPHFKVLYTKDKFSLTFCIKSIDGYYDIWGVSIKDGPHTHEDVRYLGKSWMPVWEIVEIFEKLKSDIRDNRIDGILD